MSPVIWFSLITFFSSGALAFEAPEIKAAILHSKLPQEPAASDPDYPIYVAMKVYLADQKVDPNAVINLLEPLLTKQLFKGRLEEMQEGHLRSYGTWRDLGYAVLGRAYYEKGDSSKALKYLSGFPSHSPFAEIASIQRIWALLELGQWDVAKQEIIDARRQKTRGSGQLLKEVELQLAFYYLKTKKIDEALDITENLRFQNKPSLESLRQKIRAQALYGKFEQSLTKEFSIRHKILLACVEAIQDIPPDARDEHFAFFAAEAFWQLASQLRVEDPSKYQKEVLAHLNKADEYIGPWALRTIREKRTWLSEEAMFLSAVVLWEARKYDSAIPRLLATIDVYPKTDYREDIFQLVGDHYYDRGQFHNALKYYRSLSSSGDKNKAAYGTYKAAWSFYNLNEKFKGLRHLQRLVLYYKKTSQMKIEPGNLSNEAEKDMLILLAELLSNSEAQAELDHIGYRDDDWFRIRFDLATTYGKLGKNEIAVDVWKSLLNKARNHPDSQLWLSNLLQSHLNAAQRFEIARSLEFYKNQKNPPAKDSVLEKKIVQIQLTLHREGSKTDDPEVWKAADALYKVTADFLPGLQSGDFWYFGAQRKEKLARPWEAAEWYQKAALIIGYDGAEDSAVSTLRISQAQADSLSINNKTKTEEYISIAKTTRWFLKNFGSRPEAVVAEKLYLEALYSSGNLAEAREYILLNANKSSPEFWANVIAHNKYLYDGKHWEYLFQLSDSLLNKGIKDENVRKTLVSARQEAAFEKAFELEKSPETKSDARKWYETCATVSDSFSLKIKSWHNRILSWDKNSEFQKISRDYESLQKENWFTKTGELTFDEKSLIYNIHLVAAESYKKNHDRVKQSLSLIDASNFIDNQDTRLELQWVALLGFAASYDKGNYISFFEKFKFDDHFFDLEKKITHGRILYLFGRKDDALDLVKNLISENHASVWFLLRDLHHTYPDLAGWINENQKFLQKAEPLQVFWARESRRRVDLKISLKTAQNFDENTRKTASTQPIDELKKRLEAVSRYLKDDIDDHNTLKSYFSEPHPQVRVYGLCRQAEISQATLERLETLRSPRIELPQWEEFENKLAQKIKEIALTKNKEDAECDSKRMEITHFDQLDETVSPLCIGRSCPTNRMPEPRDIQSFYKERQSQGAKFVYQLIQMGAWITAEQEARLIQDKDERSIALTLLRLAVNDRWTAATLLKNITSEKWKPTAQALLNRISQTRTTASSSFNIPNL